MKIKTLSFRRYGRMVCMALVLVRANAQDKSVSLSEAAGHAVRQSKLTLPGSAPFHLKAHITQKENAKPEYQADVEEYWVSPEKWRRTVQSRNFSQVLIVNGAATSEKLTGDYYPFWLHDLVTALFDPLPMADQLKRLQAQVEIPDDSVKSRGCVNMQSRVGVPPVQNTVAFAFCFGGQKGLLQAVSTPAYSAEFADYQKFAAAPMNKAKWVARTVSASFAPGTTIEARITELAELAKPDESLFAIEEPTPPAVLIKSGQVGEDSARVLAMNTPAIVWPSVREGKTSGVLSLYISVDRGGRVREVWPVNSDNAELNAAAREQVLQWQYRPYLNDGPTQMEAVLTFSFTTKIENPIAVLKDAEARKRATRIVEAVIPAGKARKGAGPASFTLRASVDETGKVTAVLNPNNVYGERYSAGTRALKMWRFRPYINRHEINPGKPDRFYADITFHVP